MATPSPPRLPPPTLPHDELSFPSLYFLPLMESRVRIVLSSDDPILLCSELSVARFNAASATISPAQRHRPKPPPSSARTWVSRPFCHRQQQPPASSSGTCWRRYDLHFPNICRLIFVSQTELLLAVHLISAFSRPPSTAGSGIIRRAAPVPAGLQSNRASPSPIVHNLRPTAPATAGRGKAEF